MSFSLLDICGDSISVGDIVLRAKTHGSSGATLRGYIILKVEEAAKIWKVFYSGVYVSKYSSSIMIREDSGYMQFNKSAAVGGVHQSFDLIKISNPEFSLNQQIFQILFEKKLELMDSMDSDSSE
jgi:hypothetical protein